MILYSLIIILSHSCVSDYNSVFRAVIVAWASDHVNLSGWLAKHFLFYKL